jgi:hypothetical protein
MLAMPTAINQTTAIRQSYQLDTVSSRTYYSAIRSRFFWQARNALTAEDLKDLDVSIVGHRRKILDAIAGGV